MRPALFAVLLALAAPARGDDESYRARLAQALVDDTEVPDPIGVSLKLSDAAAAVRGVRMGCGQRDLGCNAMRSETLRLLKELGVAPAGMPDLEIMQRYAHVLDRYAQRSRVRQERHLDELARLTEDAKTRTLSERENQRLRALADHTGMLWKALDAGALPTAGPRAGAYAGRDPDAIARAIREARAAPVPGIRKIATTAPPSPPLHSQDRSAAVSDAEMERICAFDIGRCNQLRVARDKDRFNKGVAECTKDPLGCEHLAYTPLGMAQDVGLAVVHCSGLRDGSCAGSIAMVGVGLGCTAAGPLRGPCRNGVDAAGQAALRAGGRVLRETAEIGTQLLGRHGVPVSKEMAERLAASERAVAELNGAYRHGYHGAGHQVGEGSVADLAVRSAGLDKLVKPEGMSQKTFDEVRAKFYLGALVHDVEGVVVVRQGERAFIKYADSTKTQPIDISQLGAPVSVQRLPDGSEKLIYAKAPDSRSNLLTTMRMLNESPTLAAANDPLAKWMALKGTAFSPQEKALADRMLPILEAKIRRQYGNEADAVLRMAGPLADRMGVADVFNHYVRDTASAVRQMQSLEKEFANPAMVNVRGTFGFFEFVVAKDEKLIKGFTGLPAAEQEAFRRNLVAFSLLQKNPGLLSEGVENAAQRLARSPEVDAIIKANPQWANLSLPELIQAAKGAKSSALATEARDMWRKANGELIDRNLAITGRETREQAVRQQMPALKDPQVAAVTQAHERFPCAGRGCTQADLRGKYELLSAAGLTPAQIREVLDRGLAGKVSEWLGQRAPNWLLEDAPASAVRRFDLPPAAARLEDLLRTQPPAQGMRNVGAPLETLRFNGGELLPSRSHANAHAIALMVQQMRSGQWDWTREAKIGIARGPRGEAVIYGPDAHAKIIAARYARIDIPPSAYERIDETVSPVSWSQLHW